MRAEPEIDDERPPRPEVIRGRIEFLAQDTRNVIITDHAEERMFERGITSKMMFEALRNGMIKGEVTLGKKTGDWKVKLASRATSGREVGVVTAVVQDAKLVIITVEWEDLR